MNWQLSTAANEYKCSIQSQLQFSLTDKYDIWQILAAVIQCNWQIFADAMPSIQSDCGETLNGNLFATAIKSDCGSRMGLRDWQS